MDPLNVLRDFNTTNKLQLVQQVGGNVQFGDRYNFPASTPVYKAAGAAGGYYSLQDVLFYLKNRHLKPQEYVMAASQAGVSNVNIVDRKKVLDVLDGVAPLDPALLPPLSLVAAATAGGAGGAAAAGRGAPSGGLISANGGAAVAGAAGAAAAGRAPVEGAEPQAKRQRVADDEASAMRGLLEQERQLRSRNTMLLAPNKDFRRVLEVVSNVRKQAAQQQAAARAAAAKAAPPPAAGGKHASASRDGRGSSSRYGRDSTADQLKAMAPGAGGALAINMYGTSGKAAAAPPPPPPSGAAGYVPVRKSGSAGSAPPPPPPPQQASQSGKPPSSGKPHGSQGSKGAAASGTAAGGKGEAKKGGVPIIIVPSGLTSLINMYNAKAFLEEGRFVPSAQAQAAAGGALRPSSLTIRRTAHRAAPGVEYALTDKPPAAGSADWDRVVAVLVQGAKWQFKDWPHKGAKEGELVEAFSKVCGFYVHYSDEKVGPPVCDWNVSLVPLHRENRHKDMTAMMGLFRHLDTFLQARRSTLAY